LPYKKGLFQGKEATTLNLGFTDGGKTVLGGMGKGITGAPLWENLPGIKEGTRPKI